MAERELLPMGPAIVEYGDEDPVIFDATKGGVVLTVETEVYDGTIDQSGNTPVKSVLLGRQVQVQVPVAEYDLEKLAKVTPDSELVEDGDKIKLIVKANAGFNLLNTAQKLVIKPTDPSTNANHWVTVPKAAPMADIEATYDSENERIYNVTFKAYVDAENGNQVFILGDETANASGGGGGGGEE